MSAHYRSSRWRCQHAESAADFVGGQIRVCRSHSLYGGETAIDQGKLECFCPNVPLILFLQKGRSKARQKKMFQIAQMLEIPGQLTAAADSAATIYGGAAASASASALRSSPGHAINSSTARVAREHRPLFSTAIRAPGVAAALRRDSAPSAGVSRIQMITSRAASGESAEATGSSSSSVNSKSHRSLALSTAAAYLRDASSDRTSVGGKSRDSSKNRSRDSSPRMPRPR